MFLDKSVNPKRSPSLKMKVAREAAHLLYRGIEKEYKQAKLKAAKILRTSLLPSNLQVAIQLDKIAEENEGEARKKQLIHLRKQALELMKLLRAYNPVLVGSAWRGTVHHNSDIDLEVYHQDPQQVLEKIDQNDLKVLRTERVKVTQEGRRKEYFHIYLKMACNETAEVVVRSPEEADQERRCEIYGDEISGLTFTELKKLLEEDPTKRFVPF